MQVVCDVLPHPAPDCMKAPNLVMGVCLQPTGFTKPKSITDREDDYKKRRLGRKLSPERNDPFLMGDKTPDARVRTYADVMREQMLQREQANTVQNILDKQKQQQDAGAVAAAAPVPVVGQKRRNRWDQSADEP
eukprot:GHUV01049566.1.p1 GENE.GHUV01049566.1~~GHUV01049566.1.p1  ORF type:complete len:134 (-),score=30.14 GHUV01049566.1:137-538(-)